MKVATALAILAVTASVSSAPVSNPQAADALEARTTFVAPVLTGYQTPVSWGKGTCAINAPANTYLGSVWVGGATDYSVCAAQCNALTINDSGSAKANTLFNSCNYFTAYQLYDGSSFLGTQCGLYTRNMQNDETDYDQNCGNGKINLKNVVSYAINGYVGNSAAMTALYRSDLSLTAAAAVKARVAAAAAVSSAAAAPTKTTSSSSSSSSTSTTSKSTTTSANGFNLPIIPLPVIPTLPTISIPSFGFKAAKSAASATKSVAKATAAAKKH